MIEEKKDIKSRQIPKESTSVGTMLENIAQSRDDFIDKAVYRAKHKIHYSSPILHHFQHGMKDPLSYDPEKIADDIARDQYCIIDNFINDEHINQLLSVIGEHRKNENFRKAGIGNLHHFKVHRGIRGDEIKWIERSSAHPSTIAFLDQIESFMNGLNRLLYLSLKDYECHFAVYPPGTFYERHLDQFKTTNNRKISFAFYLNKNWKPGAGGEIRIFREDGIVDIPPVSGRLVVFRSDVVEHEVLMTNVERYSITGWLRDRPIDLPFVS